MVTAKTCDYAGNGGLVERPFFGTQFSEQPDPNYLKLRDEKKVGYLPLRFNMRSISDFPYQEIHLPGHMRSSVVSSSSVRDGLSNTIALWESAGTNNFWRSQGTINERTWIDWVQNTDDIICITESPQIWIQDNSPSVHGYHAAWSGLNRFRARAWDEAGENWGSPFLEADTYHRFINANNAYRSPFSFHPTICMAVNGDGSVRVISETVTPHVFMALITRAGGETIDD